MGTLDQSGIERENPDASKNDSEDEHYHLYNFPSMMYTPEMEPVRQFEEKGQYQKALDALEQVIQKQPDNPQYLNHKASLLSRMGRVDKRRLEEAKELLLKIIKDYSDNFTAREYLAMIYIRLGDGVKAENGFLELLKMNKTNAFANYMMGVLKFKRSYRKTNTRRAAETAVEYFERASDLKKDFLEKYSIGHYELITAYAWAGKIEKAIEFMQECIKKSPEMECGLASELGGIAIKQQQFWDAIELKTRALELDPTNAMDYNERGRAYSYLNQDAFAVEDYSKAIELDPSLIYAYQNRGILYVKTRNWDKAIEDLDFALERWPNYYGHYSRAIAHLRNGELDLALEDVANARKKGGTYKQISLLDELSALIQKYKRETSSDIDEVLHGGHNTRRYMLDMVRTKNLEDMDTRHLRKKERGYIGDTWHGSTEKKKMKGKSWRSAGGRYAHY